MFWSSRKQSGNNAGLECMPCSDALTCCVRRVPDVVPDDVLSVTLERCGNFLNTQCRELVLIGNEEASVFC